MRNPSGTSWTRHFVYRTEHLRTTWRFRLAFIALVVGAVWLTSGWWTITVARSLICERTVARSDAILIENFDPGYLLFEEAARLRRAGLAPRVLVPVPTSDGTGEPNAVARGIAEMMASLSRLGEIDIVPIREVEPISLNAARELLRFSKREGIRSVIVVSPLFRSRRSALIYSASFSSGGISVRCDPVDETRDVSTWTDTWHGIQNVAEQWIKFQYYRWYVLPFRSI